MEEKVYMKAKSQWPISYQAVAAPAESTSRTNQWMIAVERWHQVKEQFSNRPMGHIGYGNALVELERYEEAQNVFQDAANRWQDNEQVLLRLAYVTYQSLHWPEALASLENALTRFPDSSNLWLKYGDLLLDLYEFEKAERVFLTTMGNWPDSLLRMKNMPEQPNGPGVI